ncbi:MAG: 2OG-Fe(II) oxygenase [Kangiellaceae bacterium]|jgi:hypothetical protein|nr:2OG-Fe(II) oxygenase [Kangiellaceae bacterium]
MQNFIIQFQQAFSPEFCQQLIDKFESDSNKQAGRTGAGVDKAKKDSIDLYISHEKNWQEEVSIINNTITQGMVQYTRQYPFVVTGAVSPSIQVGDEIRTITNEDIAQLNDEQLAQLISSIYTHDDINMQKYLKGTGGYHHWHSEHFPHPTDQSQRSLRRTLLWLIYLNDVADGGETEFFYQGAKVKPTQGSLVLAPCTFTHTHRGSIPQSNDKYVLASWLMYKSADELYPK